MEYKYEQIFGDQSLFDGAPEDAEAVGGGKPLQDALVFYKFSDGEFQYKYEAEIDDWKVSTCKHPQSVIKAMRRIIKEPKRWTRADMDAGRLPEVGAFVLASDGLEYEFVGESVYRGKLLLRHKSGNIFDLDSFRIKPIETPEEKAQRERDEWIDNACSFICFYDIGRVDAIKSLEITYDKLKSGELPMPNKE